jgi:hypothetical protein
MTRVKWGPVLERASEIVESYDTPVTLRQLFYRLVASLVLPNVLAAYKALSARTAESRRDGDFPDLTDRTRTILEYQTFDSPADAIRYAAKIYRRDRTEGQPVSIYLAVEKDGMVAQLDAWFSHLGLPILALRGYASQSYVDAVVRHVEHQGRPVVLIGTTDHDPTGWDIWRDFIERTGCWKAVHRIALTAEQVEQYGLPEAVDNDPLTAEKLQRDSRAKGFVERFGRLTQVELDALDPDVLHQLYADAVGLYWDTSAYEAVLEQEADEVAELEQLVRGWAT